MASGNFEKEKKRWKNIFSVVAVQHKSCILRCIELLKLEAEEKKKQ